VQVQDVHAVGKSQLASQVRAWQAPHPLVVVVPGVQVPSPPHGLHRLHVQSVSHDRVCDPHMPQPRDSLAPAAHGPSPAHALHSPQLQVASQSRVDVPQLPQSRDSIVPGMQVPGSAPQARHMPERQLSPAVHGVPGQQGSPAPPHA
jgi:hypothetical protein